jgi:hypothetical protein
MKAKFIASIGVVALITYIAASPVLAINSMKKAAKEQDSETLRTYIDFDKLRENVKDTIRTKTVERLATETEGNKMAAGFALMMINAMLDPMVDAFISPKGLANMLQGQKPAKPTQNTIEEEDNRPKEPQAEPETSYRYESYSTFIVDVKNPDDPDQKFSFILNRQGMISDWKLIDIALPL